MRSVATQVAASILATQIDEKVVDKIPDGQFKTFIAEASSATSSGIMGKAVSGVPLSLQSMATNAVGSSMGDEIGGEASSALDRSTPSVDEAPSSAPHQPAHTSYSSHDSDAGSQNFHTSTLGVESITPLDKQQLNLLKINPLDKVYIDENTKDLSKFNKNNYPINTSGDSSPQPFVSNNPSSFWNKTKSAYNSVSQGISNAANWAAHTEIPKFIGDDLYETIHGTTLRERASGVAGLTMVAASAFAVGDVADLGIGLGKYGASLAKNSFSTLARDVGRFWEKEASEQISIPGTYRVPRKLPQTSNGVKIPDSDRPHTQIGQKKSKKAGDYTQAREWGYDNDGNLIPKKDIDFTDHGRPLEHSNPHQHVYKPNPTGGTYQRTDEEPLNFSNDDDNSYRNR